MQYLIQEGSFQLQGQWRDTSTNILIAEGLAIEGVNLIVTRHRLAAGGSFDSFLAVQRNYIEGLQERKVLADRPGIIDRRTAHFFEVTWVNEGRPLHQMVLLILHDTDRILNMSTTIPGQVDDSIRRSLLDAMGRVTFSTPISAPAS